MNHFHYLSASFITGRSGIIIPFIFGMVLVFIGLSGCSNNSDSSAASSKSPTPVYPSDCNRASGYFWSELMGDCVELFQVARKLKAVSENVNKHGSVFVVINADSSRVEMYMPFTRQETIIMEKVASSSPSRWKNEQYTLIDDPAMRLMEGEQILYEEQLQ